MGLSVDIKKKLGDFTLEVAFDTGSDRLGLLGASGCGKSMTLKCIAGVEKPDEGRIVLGDRVLFDSATGVNLKPQQRKVGYLFQEYALFPNMTVAENIRCGAGSAEKTGEYIQRYALEGLEKLYPAQISGGQKQRVALARMLSAEPEAVLLDEPFTALDNFLKSRMERQLMEMMEDFRGPVVFVSHDRNESYRLTDTIAVMENGHLVDLSEKHALFRAPKTLASTLLTGCKNVSRVRRLPDGTYKALDWGIRLRGPEGAYSYVAFRAHDPEPVEEAGANTGMDTGTVTNLLECEVLRQVEDTFSAVLQFYQKGLQERTEYSLLTYECGKEEMKELLEKYPEKPLHLRIPEKALIWLEK